MSITGITVTPDNGVQRVIDAQNCNGAIIDGETVVLDNVNSRLSATSASGLLVTNSQIKCDSDIISTYNDPICPITYGSRGELNNKVRITQNSLLLFAKLAGRKNILISELSNSNIIESGGARNLTVYTQTNAILDNCIFRGIGWWEVYRTPSIASNITIDSSNYGYLNWEASRLDFLGFAVSNIGVSHAWLGSGNGGNNFVYHWNNDISFDNKRIKLQHINNQYWEGYTWSPQFIDRDTGISVKDVLVIYDSDLSGTRSELSRFTTDVSGKMVGTYDSKNQSTGINQVRDTLFLLTAKSNVSGTLYTSDGGNTYSIDVITPYIEIRSYLHEIPNGYLSTDSLVITSPRGVLNSDYSVNTYENFILILDKNIAEVNKTIVAAYTALETPEKFYDRAKSEWRDNDGYPIISRSGNTIDAGAYDVTIDATAASAFTVIGNKITIKSTTFTGNLTTTGIITLLNGAAVNGTRTDMNGTISPPISVTLSGLKVNSEVRAYVGINPVTATEIAGVESSTTSFAFTQSYAGQSGYIVIFAIGYQPLNIPITYASSNQTIPIQQIIDRNYNNPI